MKRNLTEQWLLTPQGNVWTLTTNDIYNKSPYAFIGNGYIGQQIPPEGEGILSGSFVHGIYHTQPLVGKVLDFVKKHSPLGSPLAQESLLELPCWHSLRYCDGVANFSRDIGIHDNYQQTLDLKTATVETFDKWTTNDNHTTKIITTSYLSYVNRNLAVISTSITPEFSGEIYFEDIIDSSSVSNISNSKITTGDIMRLIITAGSNQNQILIASKIIVPQNTNCRTEFITDELKITRRIYLQVANNQTYTITKLVGIYTNQDGNNLEQKASFMLASAAKNLTRECADHEQEWKNLWRHRIEITGADGLQKLLNAALYQFYSQLRKDIHWSLGPTGISGCRQWAGIIFWDADLWMGQPLALLNPILAESIFRYRYKTLAGAKLNAAKKNLAGAQYAWESTITGEETCYAYTANQPHTISDVAFSQWQYCLVSANKNYLKQAEEVILECAKYWEHRVTYNEQHERYEIKQVCCADEYSGIVDNNTYTNYSAIKTLEIASRILKSRQEEIPPKWRDIMQKMYLPFDSQKELYLEYEGYNGAAIKQADTALLIYPYEMPITNQQKSNIVEYYRTKYPENKIMMSSAFDGIIYCEQKKPQQAWQALLDLLPHFTTPFLQATESPQNDVIFLTGLGGLLQLIMNGFAGLRIREDKLEFNPCLPSQIKNICLKGIHHQGKCFDVKTMQNISEILITKT